MSAVLAGVDLTPLADAGVEMLAAVASAVALWALGRLMRWLKIDGDAKANALLHAAVDRAVAAAAGRARAEIATRGVTVDLRSTLAAEVAGYLVANVPDTLKRLGATPATVSAVVTARLDALLPPEPVASLAAPPAPPVPSLEPLESRP